MFSTSLVLLLVIFNVSVAAALAFHAISNMAEESGSTAMSPPPFRGLALRGVVVLANFALVAGVVAAWPTETAATAEAEYRAKSSVTLAAPTVESVVESADGAVAGVAAGRVAADFARAANTSAWVEKHGSAKASPGTKDKKSKKSKKSKKFKNKNKKFKNKKKRRVSRDLKRKAPQAAHVHVSQSASYSTLQRTIDRCRGAVWYQHRGVPGLIAEHDYCGGAKRLGSHRHGDIVRVTGSGVRDGLYRVVSKKTVAKGSSFSVLRGMGDVVLQTCYRNRLLLTGIKRVR